MFRRGFIIRVTGMECKLLQQETARGGNPYAAGAKSAGALWYWLAWGGRRRLVCDMRIKYYSAVVDGMRV